MSCAKNGLHIYKIILSSSIVKFQVLIFLTRHYHYLLAIWIIWSLYLKQYSGQILHCHVIKKIQVWNIYIMKWISTWKIYFNVISPITSPGTPCSNPKLQLLLALYYSIITLITLISNCEEKFGTRNFIRELTNTVAAFSSVVLHLQK